MYLQLAAVIQKTHEFVKTQAVAAGSKKKKQKPVSATWKKRKADKGGSFNAFGEDFVMVAAEMGDSLEHPTLAPPIAGAPDTLMQSHKRMILHDRVMWLLNLRSQQMSQYISGINAPGKFVHIDAFWLDNLMHAFSECDDWASLLKACPTFRNPKKR